MAKRYRVIFVGFATGAWIAWGGSTRLAAASTSWAQTAGGLLNGAPEQVPTAVLASVVLFGVAAGLFLIMRDGFHRPR
jgi:hypothetical protein